MIQCYLMAACESREILQAEPMLLLTKCENDITDSDKTEIINQINKYSAAKIYFSTLHYGSEIMVSKVIGGYNLSETTEMLCVTGVANANPLLKYLAMKYKSVKHLNFGDHYNYKTSDIQRIINNFDNIANEDKAIITTQKDWMRLKQSIPDQILNRIPIYIQPVKSKLDSSNTREILDLIISYDGKN